MTDVIDRLQQSAHLTADDNAAHALHSAVVEIRKLGAALQHSQALLADTQKRLAIAERNRCGGMIDDMATQRECAKACMRRMDELGAEKKTDG